MWSVWRYLLWDLIKSWIETPFSFGVKFLIALCLAGGSMLVMLGYSQSVEELRKRIMDFGGGSVVIQEVAGDQALLHDQLPTMQTTLPLERMVRLTQMGATLRGGGQEIPVYAYEIEDAVELRDMPLRESSVLWLGGPVDAGVDVILSTPRGKQVRARTVDMPAWFSHFGANACVLAGRNSTWLQEARAVGHTTWLEVAGDPTQAVSLARDLRRLAHIEQEHARPPYIRDVGGLLGQLSLVAEEQSTWRMALLAALIPSLTLVLGTLAVLEFRQSRFVAALMRSMGTPTWLMWLRLLADMACPVLLAGVCGVMLVRKEGWRVFEWLDLGSAQAPLHWDWNWLIQGDGLWIMGALLIGVLLSALPLGLGLTRPVGRVLS